MVALDSGGTLSTTLFRSIADALARRGVCSEPLFSACGLTPEILRDPAARVPIEREHRLWAAIERCTGDPAIGLAIGADFARRGRHTVDLYLVLNSATVREALQIAERFARVGDDRGHLEVSEGPVLATVRAYREGGHPRAYGFLDALLASMTTALSDRVAGFRVRRVQLKRPRPKAVGPYVAMFGIVPEFGAPHAALSFERAFLDAPLRGSDAVLAEILMQQALQLLTDGPRLEPLIASVQRVLVDGFARGQTNLPAVARALGTSARTLRRRLALAGTSFQAVLDGMRRDLAAHYLHHGDDSIARIADRLGFANASAFQRAFQRWNGVAPSRFRAQREVVPPT